MKSRLTTAGIFMALLAMLFVMHSTAADAQTSGGGSQPVKIKEIGTLDEISEKFRTETRRWIPKLKDLARNILLWLAAIGIVYQLIKTLFTESGWPELFGVIVFHLLTVGFYFAVITEIDTIAYGVMDFLTGLPSDLLQGGMVPAGTNLEPTPSNVVEIGWNTAQVFFDAKTGWNIPAAIIFHAVGVVMIIIYAVIGAYIVLIQVEGFFVIAYGVILLGFAGTHWTEDAARRYLNYIIGFAFRLSSVYMIVTLGSILTQSWVANEIVSIAADPDDSLFSAIPYAVGIPLIVLMLSFMVPSVLAQLASGMSSDSGLALNSLLTSTLMNVSSVMKSAVGKAGTVAATGGMALKAGAKSMGAPGVGAALKSNPMGLLKTSGRMLGGAALSSKLSGPKDSVQRAMFQAAQGGGGEGGSVGGSSDG